MQNCEWCLLIVLFTLSEKGLGQTTRVGEIEDELEGFAGNTIVAVAKDAPASGSESLWPGCFYVSAQYQSTSDFPTTLDFSGLSSDLRPFRANGSSARIACGVNGPLFSSQFGYGSVELGFSWTGFSDANVTGKTFYFLDLSLAIGISPSGDGRSAFYGILGGGLVYHSEEEKYQTGSGLSDIWSQPASTAPSPTYYLETSVGAVSWGVGLKLVPLSKVSLSVEYIWMYNSGEKGTGIPVPDQPGWEYARYAFDPIGNRLTVGVSYSLFTDMP